jgi:hypothetical protein
MGGIQVVPALSGPKFETRSSKFESKNLAELPERSEIFQFPASRMLLRAGTARAPPISFCQIRGCLPERKCVWPFFEILEGTGNNRRTPYPIAEEVFIDAVYWIAFDFE